MTILSSGKQKYTHTKINAPPPRATGTTKQKKQDLTVKLPWQQKYQSKQLNRRIT